MVNEQTIKTGARSMPSQSAVANPPAVTEQSEADRARAALGGTPMEALPEIDEQEAPPPPRPHVRGKNAPPPARFKPPTDLEFEFTHPERVELHNSNLPLTLGLLGSIIGAFVVFFVSLSGGTAGQDPIMPSFWRALAALAVLMTLSFAASWFMPAPINRRGLLDHLDAEERLTYEHLSGGRKPGEKQAPPPAQEETDLDEAFGYDMGGNIDVTVEDEDEFNAGLGGEDLDDDFLSDDFEEEDDDPFLSAASEADEQAASVPAKNEGQ